MPTPAHPRRAAVSAFGFGGSNFHCVLEEANPHKEAIDWDGETQIVAFSGATPADIERQLSNVARRSGWVGFSCACRRDAPTLGCASRMPIAVSSCSASARICRVCSNKHVRC